MLHIVLPVHNRRAVTEGFVRALLAQTVADYRLVLVDDGCTDGTADMAHRLLPPERLEVLRGDGQLWWAGALQIAWKHLSAKRQGEDDAVLIVNDDVRIEPDFLAGGLVALTERPNACIQAIGFDPSTGDHDLGAIADLRHLRFRAASAGERPDCLSTRGLLMHLRTFVDSGGFRPQLLPHYLSDYEFTLRQARRGVPLITDERFRLVADHATTGDQAFDGQGLRAFVERSLSNRAKYNPKHWSALAWLVSPSWAAPLLVTRIWLGFVRRALRVALAPAQSTTANREQAGH